MSIALFVECMFMQFFTCWKVQEQGKKKKSWCFVKRRIKKTTLEHPFFFPLPSFLPMHFFFQQQFEQELLKVLILKLLLKVKQQ
jgi:hypothetical protein